MSKLFEALAGEYITLLLKKDVSDLLQDESGRYHNVKSTMVSEGYLIDEDDKYYYIGDKPTSFNEMVDKDIVFRILVGKVQDQVHEPVSMPDINDFTIN